MAALKMQKKDVQETIFFGQGHRFSGEAGLQQQNEILFNLGKYVHPLREDSKEDGKENTKKGP